MGYNFDVTVIGGGPGGYVAAIQAGKSGKMVCLIEKDKLGGTCLNMGCIPTTVFLRACKTLNAIKCREFTDLTGADFTDITIDMKALQQRKAAVSNQLVNGVSALLSNYNVTVIHGTASFQGPHSISVGKEIITSEYFVIASGSGAYIPDSIKISGENRILGSREFLELDEVPESMIILGGGVIGLEFAYIMNTLGCKICILELAERILPAVDEDISDIVYRQLEKSGITFFLGAELQSIDGNAVSFFHQGMPKEIEASCLLHAMGRKPYMQNLNPEAAGLSLDHSVLVCDETMRTSVPNIYAVGDVTGKSMLAQTAFYEAVAAVKNICGEHKTVDYSRIPYCVHTSPEIACIGLDESSAKEKYGEGNIKVGKFPLRANGKSIVENDFDGFVKVIIEKNFGEILGVHMCGNNVTEMIYGIAVAMRSEATADEFINSVYPHPSVSEAIGEAFWDAWTGKAIHNI